MRLIAIPRLMVVVVAVFAGWYSMRLRNRPASGTVIVDGTSFTIDDCRKVPVAGADSIGADLRSSDRNVVRVVRDEHGVQLVFYLPGAGGAAMRVDGRDCSQWDIGFSSETADPVHPVGGHATFRCGVGGEKIDGTVLFGHCPP
jgi:hypothetical protein